MSDSIIPLPERPNLADAGPWGVCAVMEEYVPHGPGDLKPRVVRGVPFTRSALTWKPTR